MEKITLKYGFDNLLTKYLIEERNTVLVVHEQTEVSYGNQNDINLEYCESHNIPAYNLQRDGGCIVYAKGNVSFADVRPNNSKDFELINIKFLIDFTKFLENKGLNVVRDNNDILVDGYKVASGAAINLLPDWKRTFSTVQISINQDIEAIKGICLKPMKKEPKGLSEYGITTKEVELFVMNWFKTNN